MQLSWDKFCAFIKDRHVLIFLLCLAGFIIFKLPHLSLPYFWDEAWSYIPAIHMMEKNGLSLLPDALPPEISRGHPLLFYFLAAFWMKIFVESVIVMHSFAMVISIMLLFLIYYVGVKLFSRQVALFSAVILCVQAIFLAQSSFVLPEIFLAFWTLLCIYLFVIQRFVWFVLAGSLMLLTKETGVVVLFSIGLWLTMYMLVQKKIFSRHYMKSVFLVFIPLLIASVYFVIQHAYYGWYFFPEHIGMMHFERGKVMETLKYGYEVITRHQGRTGFSVMVLGALLLILLKGKNLFIADHDKKQVHFIGISVCFILSMLVFSSINFFTDRYLFCILPIYILLGCFILVKVIGQWHAVFSVLYLLPIFNCFSYNLNSFTPSDTNLSYQDGVKVQMEVTRFVEEQLWYEKNIYVTFLYSYCLGAPETKYRSTPYTFTSLNYNLSCENEYFIYTNIESDPAFEKFKESCSLNLVKKFEKGKVWAEIYERKPL